MRLRIETFALLLFVAIGLCFEALKHVDNSETAVQVVKFDWRNDMGLPVAQSENTFRPPGAASPWHMPHIANQAIKPKSVTAPPTKVAANAKKDDKKKQDKKDKKKEEKKTAQQNKPQNPPANKTTQVKDAKPQYVGSQPISPETGASNANLTPDKTPNLSGGAGSPSAHATRQTIKDWEDYILPSPNFDHVEQLVEAYKAHQVNKTVFYQVLTDMMKDSRDFMKQLAVMAINSTPSSDSFELAATTLAKEPNGSPLHTALESSLNEYANVSSLKILTAVLKSSSDPAVVSQALQKATTAVASLSKTGTLKSQNLHNTNNASTLADLQQLLPVLTTLESNNSDPTIKSSAAQTLQTIQQLLS